jgi:hypothetical protein
MELEYSTDTWSDATSGLLLIALNFFNNIRRTDVWSEDLDNEINYKYDYEYDSKYNSYDFVEYHKHYIDNNDVKVFIHMVEEIDDLPNLNELALKPFLDMLNYFVETLMPLLFSILKKRLSNLIIPYKKTGQEFLLTTNILYKNYKTYTHEIKLREYAWKVLLSPWNILKLFAFCGCEVLIDTITGDPLKKYGTNELNLYFLENALSINLWNDLLGDGLNIAHDVWKSRLSTTKQLFLKPIVIIRNDNIDIDDYKLKDNNKTKLRKIFLDAWDVYQYLSDQTP